jgi:YVTN family beta-propeller protein
MTLAPIARNREENMRWALSTLLLFAACVLASAPTRALAQTVIATVTTGADPVALAVNPGMKKVYVVNRNSNSVTIIDEGTNSTAQVAVGSSPRDVAVNSVTNKIYVANYGDATVTVIDGPSLSTKTVRVGSLPRQLAVNTVTNKVYITGYTGSGTVTVIDGATNTTASITVGPYPTALAANTVTNRIYVANSNETVSVIDGKTNSVVTVPAGLDSSAIAVNSVTNRIYVANQNIGGPDGSVTVIDGDTNSTSEVEIPGTPYAIAVNPVTNKIYVANFGGGSVTIMDGATLEMTVVGTDGSPVAVAVDPVTDKVYVANYLWNGTVTLLDGTDNSTISIPVGHYPGAVVVSITSNRIYVANEGSNTVTVVAGANSPPLQFVPVVPCRIADTRLANGTFGGPPIAGGTSRDFPIPQSDCNIPDSAAAYSLNVTVVPHGLLGYLTVWPSGEVQPLASTLNSLDGRVKANAAIVPAGVNAAVSVFATHTTDVVLDINGYFVLAAVPSSLAFYSLPPCRILDTRNPNGPLGGPYLEGGQQRDFPVLASPCGIPSSAQAYSLNFTAIPRHTLGYLTTWPTGQGQPLVSTLNAPTGAITANAALVPAGIDGNISVYVKDNADLVVDINGYFAPTSPGGLSLHATAPCRVLDTRNAGGAFHGTITVAVTAASCGLPSAAQAFVFNATVVPQTWLGYLTLWPHGGARPLVSTLNADDGAVTSNMAVVPSGNGSIDAYASNPTQLILDSFAYFAP